jgi:hypothetical protein
MSALTAAEEGLHKDVGHIAGKSSMRRTLKTGSGSSKKQFHELMEEAANDFEPKVLSKGGHECRQARCKGYVKRYGGHFTPSMTLSPTGCLQLYLYRTVFVRTSLVNAFREPDLVMNSLYIKSKNRI